MQIRTILYQYIKTLIKHVFLLNFIYELSRATESVLKSERDRLENEEVRGYASPIF